MVLNWIAHPPGLLQSKSWRDIPWKKHLSNKQEWLCLLVFNLSSGWMLFCLLCSICWFLKSFHHISPKEALCKNNDIYPGSVRPLAQKHDELGVVDRSMPMGSSATAGKLLSYCKSKIICFRERIGIRLCIFKIGVTSNPVPRFEMYKELGFSTMWILAISDSVDLVHMLEAALISEFHKHVGCKNREGSGGDGALNRKPPAPPPYFVYISGGRADQARWVGWTMPCSGKKKLSESFPLQSVSSFFSVYQETCLCLRYLVVI